MHRFTAGGLVALLIAIVSWVALTLAIPAVGPAHLSELAPLAIFIPVVGILAWVFIIIGLILARREKVARAEAQEAAGP